MYEGILMGIVILFGIFAFIYARTENKKRETKVEDKIDYEAL